MAEEPKKKRGRPRKAATSSAEPQIGLDEEVIENPDLAGLLELREERKGERKDATDAFKEVDQKVRDSLPMDKLQAGAILRIGRFKIKGTQVEGGKTVEFETKARLNVNIKLEEG